MTREEAARVLESMRVDYTFHKINSAIDLAVAALRGSQPGLMPCVGKMRIDIPPGNDSVRASIAGRRCPRATKYADIAGIED